MNVYNANCNIGQLICLVNVIHFCPLYVCLPPHLRTFRVKVIYRFDFAGGSCKRSYIFV